MDNTTNIVVHIYILFCQCCEPTKKNQNPIKHKIETNPSNTIFKLLGGIHHGAGV